jgi:hypothetical protein
MPLDDAKRHQGVPRLRCPAGVLRPRFELWAVAARAELNAAGAAVPMFSGLWMALRQPDGRKLRRSPEKPAGFVQTECGRIRSRQLYPLVLT